MKFFEILRAVVAVLIICIFIVIVVSHISYKIENHKNKITDIYIEFDRNYHFYTDTCIDGPPSGYIDKTITGNQLLKLLKEEGK